MFSVRNPQNAIRANGKKPISDENQHSQLYLFIIQSDATSTAFSVVVFSSYFLDVFSHSIAFVEYVRKYALIICGK